MNMPIPPALPQNKETPAVFVQTGAFSFRVAYQRSADSRKNNENGQDFLACRPSETRLAFALCDGVSQSFYGEIASQILGSRLVDWLWTVDLATAEEQLKDSLTQILQALVDEASENVQKQPLPLNLPAMVQNVLEKKRTLGSESTFAAGLIDATHKKAVFFWMGDSRLRVWNRSTELTESFRDQFHTAERWSSKRGLIGQLHLAILNTSDFDHVLCYSDGFAYLDKTFTAKQAIQPFSNHTIDQFMQDASLMPSSDDISLIEIWLSAKALDLTRPEKKLTKPTLRGQNETGGLSLAWDAIPGAVEYEGRISSAENTLSTFRTLLPAWMAENLAPQAQTIELRAWSDTEPGDWSIPFEVSDSSAPLLAQIEARSVIAPPPAIPLAPETIPSQVVPVDIKPVSVAVPVRDLQPASLSPKSVEMAKNTATEKKNIKPKENHTRPLAWAGLTFLGLLACVVMAGGTWLVANWPLGDPTSTPTLTLTSPAMATVTISRTQPALAISETVQTSQTPGSEISATPGTPITPEWTATPTP